MGEKVDIAMACVFLASRGARYVSGTTLVVDGAEWLYKWVCLQLPGWQ